MNDDYSFHVSAMDVQLALDREADALEHGGLVNNAKRLRADALHVRNAQHHMARLCPKGYRVTARIVFTFVPDVNTVLRDDIREGRAEAR